MLSTIIKRYVRLTVDIDADVPEHSLTLIEKDVREALYYGLDGNSERFSEIKRTYVTETYKMQLVSTEVDDKPAEPEPTPEPEPRRTHGDCRMCGKTVRLSRAGNFYKHDTNGGLPEFGRPFDPEKQCAGTGMHFND